jgi:hypothetical protein
MIPMKIKCIQELAAYVEKRIRIEQVNMATLHKKTAKAFSGQICV